MEKNHDQFKNLLDEFRLIEVIFDLIRTNRINYAQSSPECAKHCQTILKSIIQYNYLPTEYYDEIFKLNCDLHLRIAKYIETENMT